MKKKRLNAHGMPATFTTALAHDEAKLGAAVLVESAHALVFPNEIRKGRQRLRNAFRRHARKIGDANDAHEITNLDWLSIPVEGLVWFHIVEV